MQTIGGSGVEEKSPSDLGSTRSDSGTNMASSEWMSLDVRGWRSQSLHGLGDWAEDG